MRGDDAICGSLFSYIDLEKRCRPDHPLRVICAVANTALKSLSSEFEQLLLAARPRVDPAGAAAAGVAAAGVLLHSLGAATGRRWQHLRRASLICCGQPRQTVRGGAASTTRTCRLQRKPISAVNGVRLRITSYFQNRDKTKDKELDVFGVSFIPVLVLLSMGSAQAEIALVFTGGQTGLRRHEGLGILDQSRHHRHLAWMVGLRGRRSRRISSGWHLEHGRYPIGLGHCCQRNGGSVDQRLSVRFDVVRRPDAGSGQLRDRRSEHV